ncbi:hypothetical protein VPH35_006976 [Triticum aestivum]
MHHIPPAKPKPQAAPAPGLRLAGRFACAAVCFILDLPGAATAPDSDLPSAAMASDPDQPRATTSPDYDLRPRSVSRRPGLRREVLYSPRGHLATCSSRRRPGIRCEEPPHCPSSTTCDVSPTPSVLPCFQICLQ